MVTSRDKIVEVLRDRGEHDRAAAATCALPPFVDTARDASLLHQFGIDTSSIDV